MTKVAICITGLIRTFPKYHQTIKKYLIDSFAGCGLDSEKPDIYLYLKKNDSVHFNKYVTETVDKNTIENMFKEYSIKQIEIVEDAIVSKRDVLSRIKNKKMYTGYFQTKIGNYENEPYLILSRFLKASENMKYCAESVMKKEMQYGKEYDYIIYCRPDVEFTKYVYNTNEELIIPLGDHIDFGAILPRKHMELYLINPYYIYVENEINTFRRHEDVIYHCIGDRLKYRNLPKHEMKRLTGNAYVRRT